MDPSDPEQKVNHVTRLTVGPRKCRIHGSKLDWISSLPDDTILNILSFLHMKEAGRTCILSKRWRSLWTELVDLDFDTSRTYFCSDSLGLEQCKYVDWVNQVVGNCKSSPQINTFKVHFLLDYRHTADINNWVKFAIQKGVHNLELNFSKPPWRNVLEIPNHGYEPHYSFFRPCCPSGFAGLKTQLKCLTLVGVDITGPSLEFILFNCCNLEHLSVRGNKRISTLKIISNVPLTLRHLELNNCYYLQKLQISAENLASIILWGGMVDAEYGNVPSLKNACFGGPYGAHLIHNYHNLSSFSSQLEKLSLCLTQMATFPIGFTTFTNIKQLELTVMCNNGDSLLFLISYLEACPFMHHFILKVNWSEYFSLGPESEVARQTWKDATCTHNHLKVVEFVGFIGGSSDVELALYLVNKYALVLEKIILETREASLLRIYDSDPEQVIRDPQSRRKAAELAERVPSRIDVVVM